METFVQRQPDRIAQRHQRHGIGGVIAVDMGHIVVVGKIGRLRIVEFAAIVPLKCMDNAAHRHKHFERILACRILAMKTDVVFMVEKQVVVLGQIERIRQVHRNVQTFVFAITAAHFQRIGNIIVVGDTAVFVIFETMDGVSAMRLVTFAQIIGEEMGNLVARSQIGVIASRIDYFVIGADIQTFVEIGRKEKLKIFFLRTVVAHRGKISSVGIRSRGVDVTHLRVGSFPMVVRLHEDEAFFRLAIFVNHRLERRTDIGQIRSCHHIVAFGHRHILKIERHGVQIGLLFHAQHIVYRPRAYAQSHFLVGGISRRRWQ